MSDWNLRFDGTILNNGSESLYDIGIANRDSLTMSEKNYGG